MKKRDFLHRPVAFVGKVVFEFFNNEDANYKARAMSQLCKELRHDFNISCCSVEENLLDNPERGTLVYSLVAITKEQGGEAQEKILRFLDEHAPGRIILEEKDFVELD